MTNGKCCNVYRLCIRREHQCKRIPDQSPFSGPQHLAILRSASFYPSHYRLLLKPICSMEVLCYLGFVLHLEFLTWKYESEKELEDVKSCFWTKFKHCMEFVTINECNFQLIHSSTTAYQNCLVKAWLVQRIYACSPDDSISRSTCCHNYRRRQMHI